MTGRSFVIVGCGAAKDDHARLAGSLYTSTYFKKKRHYAVTVGDSWRILSAEHGLLHPHKEIEPYETSIEDLDDEQLAELAQQVGMELIDWIVREDTDGSPYTVEKVIVLAGRTYVDPLRERETFHAGIEPRVVFPFQELDLGGIGEQMAWLGRKIEAFSTQNARLSAFSGGESA